MFIQMIYVIIFSSCSCDSFPRLLVIAFIIKGKTNDGRNPPSCPFPALMTPFPVIVFINEEATDCINEEALDVINEAAIGAIIAGLDGNKLVEVWNIACHIYLCCFRRVVNSTLNRTTFRIALQKLVKVRAFECYPY